MSSIESIGVQGLRPLALGLIGVRGGGATGAGGRLGDTLALGTSSANEFEQAKGRLQRLDVLLSELTHLTTRQAEEGSIPERQQQIDALIASIDQAAAEVALGRGFEHIALTNVSAEVVSSNITEANFEGSLDLEINVRQSAQRAGLLLSVGAESLNLGGATSSFTIEIKGSTGSQQLTFSSSQSLNNIANAINTFAQQTGVQAELSGTGVVLRSSEFGTDEFVSVRILDDGGIMGESTMGVYGLSPDDTHAADLDSYVAFHEPDALTGVRDEGQDIVALVDGEPVFGDGATLSFSTANLTGSIELATGELAGRDGANAQNLGLLTALTVSVLKTGDGNGELAKAPDDPEIVDALRERVQGRLGLLAAMESSGATRLPPAMVAWAGVPGSPVTANEASTLAQHTRAELLGRGAWSGGSDAADVLRLLRG